MIVTGGWRSESLRRVLEKIYMYWCGVALCPWTDGQDKIFRLDHDQFSDLRAKEKLSDD